jgi:hypothetical protein
LGDTSQSAPGRFEAGRESECVFELRLRFVELAQRKVCSCNQGHHPRVRRIDRKGRGVSIKCVLPATAAREELNQLLENDLVRWARSKARTQIRCR